MTYIFQAISPSEFAENVSEMRYGEIMNKYEIVVEGDKI